MYRECDPLELDFLAYRRHGERKTVDRALKISVIGRGFETGGF